MLPTSTARFLLRAATSTAHDRVDHAFGRFRLDDRRHYRAFLRAQADAFLPVEAAIDGGGIRSVLPDWNERRRAAALIADLADLGLVEPEPAAVPDFDPVEAALGAAYVLEGSRLGGRLMARSVPDGFPRRFLDAGDPALWHVLVKTLDIRLDSQDKLDAAIAAARLAFGRFEASALRQWNDRPA